MDAYGLNKFVEKLLKWLTFRAT